MKLTKNNGGKKNLLKIKQKCFSLHIRLSRRLGFFYPKVLFRQRSTWSIYVPLVEIIYSVNTHPIGSAHSLEVDAVAFGWWQRRVPETTVTLVVSHCERLHNGEAGWKQLCSDVVRRVQDGGIAEADGGGKTLQGFWGGTASLAFAMLFHDKLVGAANATFRINTPLMCCLETLLFLVFDSRSGDCSGLGKSFFFS